MKDLNTEEISSALVKILQILPVRSNPSAGSDHNNISIGFFFWH
jgi:hypothetical protein